MSDSPDVIVLQLNANKQQQVEVERQLLVELPGTPKYIQLNDRLNNLKAYHASLVTTYNGILPENRPPVVDSPTDSTSTQADSVITTKEREDLAIDDEVNRQQIEDANLQLEALRSKETITEEDQAKISSLEGIVTSRTEERNAYRDSIQVKTSETNVANESLVGSESTKPVIHNDPNTFSPDGKVVTPNTTKFGTDIKYAVNEGAQTEGLSNDVLNTTDQSKTSRSTTIDNLNSSANAFKTENAAYYAELEKNKNILAVAKANGYDPNSPAVLEKQRRIDDLQSKIDTNNEYLQNIETNKQKIIENDKSRLYSEQLAPALETAKTNINDSTNRKVQANRDIENANRELNDAIVANDPAAIEEAGNRLKTAQMDYSQASTDLEKSTAQYNDISSTISDPEKLKRKINEDPTTLPKDETPVPDTSYGAITEDERNKWRTGELTPPEGKVYDTYTGKFVDKENIQSYEGIQKDGGYFEKQGRFVIQREDPGASKSEIDSIHGNQDNDLIVKKEKDISDTQTAIENAKTYESSELHNSEDYVNARNEALQAESNLKTQEQNRKFLEEYEKTGVWNGYTAKPQDDAELYSQIDDVNSKIVEENAKLADANARSIGKDEELNKKYDKISNDQTASILSDYEKQQKELDAAQAKESAVYNQPVTQQEANSLVQNLDNANKNAENKQKELDYTLSLARRNCESSNVDNANNCSDPSNWNSEDTARIAAAKDANDKARLDQKKAIGAVGAASQAPNGEAALTAAGLTPEQIKAAQAIQKKKSTDGIDTKQGATGFERNVPGPFYHQFPTMNAITDFRMKNGFSPYGPRDPDSIARDAVHFTIFDLVSPLPRTEESNGLTLNSPYDQSKNILGSFTIYPSTPDWLSLKHSHSWSNKSAISELAQGVLGFIDNAQALTQGVNKVLETVKTGSEASQETQTNRQIDSMSSYSGTNELTITLPFTLFTKKDFLSDIYKPLMWLTAWTYPKRLTSSSLSDDINRAINNIGDAAGSGLSDQQKANINGFIKNNEIDKAKNATLEYLKKKEAEASKQGGFGPYRYYVSKKPEYMSMRHASGLIFYPLCYISDISYTFKGPWYNYNGPALGGPSGKILSSSASEKQAEKAFRETLSKDVFEPGKNKYKAIAAYPSMAEVTITVNNAIRFFRDDWIQMYNFATDPQSLINVSVNQTGLGKLQNKDGSVSNPNSDPRFNSRNANNSFFMSSASDKDKDTAIKALDANDAMMQTTNAARGKKEAERDAYKNYLETGTWDDKTLGVKPPSTQDDPHDDSLKGQASDKLNELDTDLKNSSNYVQPLSNPSDISSNPSNSPTADPVVPDNGSNLTPEKQAEIAAARADANAAVAAINEGDKATAALVDPKTKAPPEKYSVWGKIWNDTKKNFAAIGQSFTSPKTWSVPGKSPSSRVTDPNSMTPSRQAQYQALQTQRSANTTTMINSAQRELTARGITSNDGQTRTVQYNGGASVTIKSDGSTEVAVPLVNKG